MSAELWFSKCDQVLRLIRQTQLEAIRAAATAIADCVAASGALHYYDTGHCSREPIHRSGGLLFWRPFTFSLSLDSTPSPKRAPLPEAELRRLRCRQQEAAAALAFDHGSFQAGDCLLIVSVSGKTPAPVELARRARQRGMKVIAITDLAFSRALRSEHSSGKRLAEVADIVIDNCGVFGDAILEFPNVKAPACPTSGVALCYLLWAIAAQVIAELLSRGLTPHVYRSINTDGGEEFNARAEAEYRESGI
jgi:uncharacterized phosphosugar-binding protein